MGKGGFNPIEVISDAVAAFTGNPELIPLINAGETAGQDLLSGQSIGKSLGQGAISGGEALAGQELTGAVGIGSGNSLFNDALGITGDNPADTGLPNIGGGISNLYNNASSAVSNFFSGASAPVDASTAPGVIANQGATAGLNSTASGATSGGATGAAGAAAPGGVTPDAQIIDTSSLNTNYNPANAAGGGSTGFNNTIAANPSLTTSGSSGAAAGGTGTASGSGSGFTGLDTSALSNSPFSGGGASSATGNGVPFNSSAFSNNAIDPSTLGTGAPIPSGNAPELGASQPNTGVALGKSLFDGQTGTTGAAFNNFIGANAGLAVPTAILGYEALNNSKEPKGFNQLQSEAEQLGAQGQQLENYINTGTLPPGLQGAVQQNLAAQQAAIKSSYAARGMSGSSAEQQDLQNAAIQSQTQTAQLAESLLAQGVAETGDSAGIYNNLIGDIQKSDSGLQSALAAFSAATQGQGGQAGAKFAFNPATGQFQASA